MKNQSRRSFLKTSAILGAASLSLPTKDSKAAVENELSPDRMGVLVDTTVCVGCRNCEWACKDAHQLPNTSIDKYEDRSVFKIKRRPDDKSLTVVNEYPAKDSISLPIDVKVQCMHCDYPACVSACIVGAFSKKKNGNVVWDTDKCIGCRYCMLACPFQIPTFDFDKALQPDIKKCDFCFSRTSEGLLPACVDICPVEALTYGPRTELIRIARERIKNYPEKYNKHIFGELEVGGTSWMYLSSIDFSKLDFPKLVNKPAPGVSESIQHGIFAYFVPPVSLYALLGALMWITKRRKDNEEDKA
jgi:Fe-S-cluster-containing dehydrogenase component